MNGQHRPTMAAAVSGFAPNLQSSKFSPQMRGDGQLFDTKRLSRRLVLWTVICLLPTFFILRGTAATAEGTSEASYQKACQWWPEQKKQWTGLSWTNWPHEFIVFWNGNICRDRPSSDNFLLSFATGEVPDFGQRIDDDGSIAQSLLDDYLPEVKTVLKTPQGELTQTVFAYLPDHGGKDFQGDPKKQPLVAWIKFKLKRKMQSDKPVRLWLNIATMPRVNWGEKPRVYTMSGGIFFPEQSRPYKDTQSLGKENNLLVRNDRVRVLVASDNDWEFHGVFEVPTESEDPRWETLRKNNLLLNMLRFDLTPQNGDELILAVPYSPLSRDAAKEITTVGYSRARSEMIDYWAKRIGSGNMTIRTPERQINDLYRSGTIQTLAGIEDHGNSRLLMPTGTLGYECVFSVCGSMNIHQLDLGGYHEEADRLLELWRLSKFKVTEENREYARRMLGPNFVKMYEEGGLDGFLSGGLMTGNRWAADNGAVMWAAAEHYLLTRDKEFLDRWLPVLLKACQWIRGARRWKEHDGYAGLIPPMRSTDVEGFAQTTWTEGWNYWGLSAVCKALRETRHPEAAEWEKELLDYRKRIVEVWKQDIAKCPTWTARNGIRLPFVPGILRKNCIDNHGFYPDCGPAFLVPAGVLAPRDEIADNVLAWLSEGPNVDKWQDNEHCHKPSCVIHEMSSCEPCYSWNIAARFLRGETDKFLEGFYSLAAGAFKRKTRQPIETRHGLHVFCTWFTFTWHLRNMLVFEDRRDDKLCLEYLRAIPRAWLENGKEIVLADAPTHFGKTSLRAKSRLADGAIDIELTPPQRSAPDRMTLTLRLPGQRKIRGVQVDGKQHADFSDNVITLPKRKDLMRITISAN